MNIPTGMIHCRASSMQKNAHAYSQTACPPVIRQRALASWHNTTINTHKSKCDRARGTSLSDSYARAQRVAAALFRMAAAFCKIVVHKHSADSDRPVQAQQNARVTVPEHHYLYSRPLSFSKQQPTLTAISRKPLNSTTIQEYPTLRYTSLIDELSSTSPRTQNDPKTKPSLTPLEP